jgi:predicted RNA-binding Zn ribbon-like protein
VNEALAAGAAPRVELDGGEIRIGHRHGASAVDDALATLAAPIVGELASGRPDRFRTCANETCAWTFYDASPTGRRRWCDMKTCGNRAKAARHRQRVKSEAAASPGA